MGNIVLLLVLLPLMMMMLFVVNLSYAIPYDPYEDTGIFADTADDEFDKNLTPQRNLIKNSNYLMAVDDDTNNYLMPQDGLQKRACIRRAGNCDHRQNDCCYSSSCRCNLWGSNCRCQRMGLFQKWG